MSDAPNALPSTRLSQISPKDETLDEDDFGDMAKDGMATKIGTYYSSYYMP